MKKYILFLVWIALAGAADAQLHNAGFEDVNTDTSMQYWGKTYVFSVVIDSTGESGDSMVIDHALYFSTTDAHTGNRAAEMRNGYYYGTQEAILGAMLLSGSQSGYPGFNTMMDVNATPETFGFYYKFFPVNQDSAMGYLGVYDADGNLIGESEIVLTATTAVYTAASQAIQYFQPGVPKYMSIRFSTGRSTGSLGTRFLVDDVSLTYSTAGISQATIPTDIQLYPNPVTEFAGFSSDISLSGNTLLQIKNAEGKTVYSQNATQTISLGHLPAGVYYWTLHSAGGSTSPQKLIKR